MAAGLELASPRIELRIEPSARAGPPDLIDLRRCDSPEGDDGTEDPLMDDRMCDSPEGDDGTEDPLIDERM